ncbi:MULTISPECIES: hypothetical protein [Nocardiopsis]|uniref:hypothetical protein n=1 Tax=Nocardiopsis TaxID=2013 RepID=UPI00034A8183|nr:MULTISPECIES: hypothetical protein [Nocardiopsis]PWV51115.1 hypothetical protein BDW27_107183 [Nocardiopsis sp. L17-MgMaSL7]
MLKKTLATGAVLLASAGVLLSAAPAAAHAGHWTPHHTYASGNFTHIKDLEAENEGCGNSNAVLGQSLGSCFNSGVIIQN